MERDPLALPGDPDYREPGCDEDSDVEIVEPKNVDIELEVELVPIQADDDYLRKRLVKPDGTAKAWTKKKPISELNDFDVQLESTHLSRSSRYETLQKKKEDFLKVDAIRKQMQKEKQQKYIDKFMEKYKQKRAEIANKPKESHHFISKKTLKKINMLALRMQKRYPNGNRSKDELVKEMVLEFKTDSKKFWEMYKQRLKDLNPQIPMTEERRQMLKERQKMYILYNKQRLKEHRVSTRKSAHKLQEVQEQTNLWTNDQWDAMEYPVADEEYLYDEEINFTDEFEAEEESLTENHDFSSFNETFGSDYKNNITVLSNQYNALYGLSSHTEIENDSCDLFNDEPLDEDKLVDSNQKDYNSQPPHYTY